MFLKFYGLREEPFGVTPDPRFLYLTPSHREAQATLDYGIKTGRGFAALVARPGMGKTTLLFHFLQRYADSAKTAFLFQTQCDSREFMRYLLAELGLNVQITDFVHLHEEFNRLLIRESRIGRKVIIVVDEAQNLSPSVLETVRLLSDFETPRMKLLHIIMAGQPELADKLATPGLAQLRQRITHFVRLDPFTPQQTDEYIDHRLRMAGYTANQPLFLREARTVIQQRSEGVPRIINNLCFNALSLGYASDKKTIDAGIAQEASVDLDIETFNWQVRGVRPTRIAAAPLYKNNPFPAFVPQRSTTSPVAQPAPMVARRAAAVPERITLVPPLPVAQPGAPLPQAEAAAASPAPVVQPEVQAAPADEPPVKHPITSPNPPPPTFEIDLNALAQDYALLEMEALRHAPAVEKPQRQVAPPPRPVAKPAPEPAPVIAEPEAEPEPVEVAQPIAAESAPDQAAPPRPDRRKYYVTAAFIVLMVLAWAITRSLTVGAHSDGSDATELPEASVPAATAEPQPSSSMDEPVVVDNSANPSGPQPAVSSVINVTAEVPSMGRRHSRNRALAEKTDGVVRRIDPIYPEAAKEALLQGRVVIDAGIASDGSLRHLRVVSGDPLLAQAAIVAVKGWLYRAPSERRRGQSDARITVNFVLNENPGLMSADENR